MSVEYRFAFSDYDILSNPDENKNMPSEQMDESSNSPLRIVSVIRKQTNEIVDVPFISIEEGDTIFVGGDAYITRTKARYLGEPFENGYIPDPEFDDASVISSGGPWDPIELDGNMKSLYTGFSEMDKDLQAQVVSCIFKKTEECGVCEIGEIINIIDSFKKTPLSVQIHSAEMQGLGKKTLESIRKSHTIPKNNLLRLLF